MNSIQIQFVLLSSLLSILEKLINTKEKNGQCLYGIITLGIINYRLFFIVMGLDKTAPESLARGLSKEYLKKIEYSSSKNMMDYEVEINNKLERYYFDEEKYKLLVSLKDTIKKELSFGCLPTDLIGWQNEVTALLKNKLEKLDLSLMEFPQNTNSTWFLNVINKEEKFIDDAKLFLNKFEKSDPKDWAIIIKEIEDKSNSNIKFWAEFKTLFNFDSLDRSDKSNILLIYDLGTSFYLNLSTKLNIILDSFKKQDILVKKNVIDAFSTVFNSFIRKENDLIDNLNRIKKRYDDTIEDVNYKTLLKKVMDLYPDLKIDKNFELIKQLEKIESRISTFPTDVSKNKKSIGLSSKIQKSKNGLKGLNWQGKQELIQILYKELLDSKLIVPIDCDESVFYDFLNNRLERQNCFIWNGELNLIAYLFEELKDRNFISALNFQYNSLIGSTGFFVKPNKELITNLKQLKSLYLQSNTGTPKNHAIIDKIISKLK